MTYANGSEAIASSLENLGQAVNALSLALREDNQERRDRFIKDAWEWCGGAVHLLDHARKEYSKAGKQGAPGS